jgi:hypothetical protein
LSYADETGKNTAYDPDNVNPVIEYTELEFKIVKASGFFKSCPASKIYGSKVNCFIK